MPEGQERRTDARNRPVILMKNGSLISMRDREKLELQSHFIYTSKLRYNASLVEDYLQQSIHHLPLGVRLHRAVAMGNNTEDPDQHEEDYLCKVFATVLPISKLMEHCKIMH